MLTLFHRFFWVTATTFLILVVTLHEIHRRLETTEIIHLEQRRGIGTAQAMANSLWVRYSSFLSGASAMAPAEVVTSEKFKEFDQLVRALSEGTNIQKVKAYATDGTVKYSTQPTEVGARKTSQVDLQKVIGTGKPLSAAEFRKTFLSMNGELADRHIVSVYIPVRNDAGSVIAAFEVYSDITSEFAELARSRWMTSMFASLLLTAAFALLFFVLRGSVSTIEKQQLELASFNQRLEAGVVERTTQLSYQHALLSEVIDDHLYRNGALAISLGRIAEVMAAGLHSQRTSVWLLNQSDTLIYCLSAYDVELDRHIDGPEIQMDACPSYKKALSRGKTLITHSRETDPIFREFNNQSDEMPLYNAVMDVPITVDGQIVGILRAESCSENSDWTPEAQLFAVSLASLATLSIERQERAIVEDELLEARQTLKEKADAA
ncbi:MAG: GAF domain-containing protein [Alphaproteobacteria bacterium]|nr:GAF domain-containing protein [Alphaproteobacteria bacterium]